MNATNELERRLTVANARIAELESTAGAIALGVLRQIADGKRRTHEQRTANACVAFIDSMRDATRAEINTGDQH